LKKASMAPRQQHLHLCYVPEIQAERKDRSNPQRSSKVQFKRNCDGKGIRQAHAALAHDASGAAQRTSSTEDFFRTARCSDVDRQAIALFGLLRLSCCSPSRTI
jgi:hypothetical protein